MLCTQEHKTAWAMIGTNLFSLRSTEPELAVLEQETEKAETFLNLHDVIVATIGVKVLRVSIENFLRASTYPFHITKEKRLVRLLVSVSFALFDPLRQGKLSDHLLNMMIT